MRFPGGCRDDRGATAVEYSLIAALIAVVMIGGLLVLGGNVSGLFGTAAGATTGLTTQGSGEACPGSFYIDPVTCDPETDGPNTSACPGLSEGDGTEGNPWRCVAPVDQCAGKTYDSAYFTCDPGTGVVSGSCPAGFSQPDPSTYSCDADAVDQCVGKTYDSAYFSCDPGTGVVSGSCPTGYRQPDPSTYSCEVVPVATCATRSLGNVTATKHTGSGSASYTTTALSGVAGGQLTGASKSGGDGSIAFSSDGGVTWTYPSGNRDATVAFTYTATGCTGGTGTLRFVTAR